MTIFVDTDADSIFLVRDEITYALGTIGVEHLKIHQGVHYFVSGFESENTDGTIKFGITVPSGSFPHMTCKISGTAQTEMRVLEDATFTGGVTASGINSNRASSNVSALTLVKDPTVSVSGVLLTSCSMGSTGANFFIGDSTGIEDRTSELILNDDTDYLIEIKSRADSNIISYIMTWYE